jgi:hypothetical protein
MGENGRKSPKVAESCYPKIDPWLLSSEYLAQYVDAVATPLRRKRSTSVDFNGMLVSYPQYLRLMKLQEKAMKLDTIMRKLAEGQVGDRKESGLIET